MHNPREGSRPARRKDCAAIAETEKGTLYFVSKVECPLFRPKAEVVPYSRRSVFCRGRFLTFLLGPVLHAVGAPSRSGRRFLQGRKGEKRGQVQFIGRVALLSLLRPSARSLGELKSQPLGDPLGPGRLAQRRAPLDALAHGGHFGLVLRLLDVV